MSVVNTVLSEVNRIKADPNNCDSVVSALEPILDALSDNDRVEIDNQLITSIESARKINRTKVLLKELVRELKQ